MRILLGVIVMLLIIVISLILIILLILTLIKLILVIVVVLIREIIVLIDQILSHVVNDRMECTLHVHIIKWIGELYATGVVFIFLHHLTLHYFIFSIKALFTVFEISELFT
jgi:hypothetical protein